MKMIVLSVIVSIAAVTDILIYKIKNMIIICGLIFGFYFQISENGKAGIFYAAAGIVLPVICLWLLFYFRAIGAGDIKLLSVVGCFIGPVKVMDCILYAIAIGGVLSLGKMLYRQNIIERFRYLFGYFHRRLQTGSYEPYCDDTKDKEEYAIHFSMAILISVVLCWEGIY